MGFKNNPGCKCCQTLPKWTEGGVFRASLNELVQTPDTWSAPVRNLHFVAVDHDVVYFALSGNFPEIYQFHSNKQELLWTKTDLLHSLHTSSPRTSVGEHGLFIFTPGVFYCDKEGTEATPHRPLGTVSVDGTLIDYHHPLNGRLIVSPNSLHAFLPDYANDRSYVGALEVTTDGTNWNLNLVSEETFNFGQGSCCVGPDGTLYYHWLSNQGSRTKNPSGVYNSTASNPLAFNIHGYPGGMSWSVHGVEFLGSNGGSRYGALMFDHEFEAEWISTGPLHQGGDGLAVPFFHPCNGGYLVNFYRNDPFGSDSTNTAEHWEKLLPNLDVDLLENDPADGRVLEEKYYFSYDLDAVREREVFNIEPTPLNYDDSWRYNLSQDDISLGRAFLCHIKTRDETPELPELSVPLSGTIARYEARFYRDTNAGSNDTVSNNYVPATPAEILTDEDFAVLATGTVTHSGFISVYSAGFGIYNIDVFGVSGGEDGGDLFLTINHSRGILSDENLPLDLPPIPLEFYQVPPIS